jgi:CspA family cold shock protein
MQWFDDSKRYGFIQQQEGEDMLVHLSASETQGFRILGEDEEVEHELRDSDEGPHVSNVIRA